VGIARATGTGHATYRYHAPGHHTHTVLDHTPDIDNKRTEDNTYYVGHTTDTMHQVTTHTQYLITHRKSTTRGRKTTPQGCSPLRRRVFMTVDGRGARLQCTNLHTAMHTAQVVANTAAESIGVLSGVVGLRGRRSHTLSCPALCIACPLTMESRAQMGPATVLRIHYYRIAHGLPQGEGSCTVYFFCGTDALAVML